MAGRPRAELPPDLAHGRQQFQAWRRARKARTRIPAPLWDLAVQLAQDHGLSRTAAVLRLDYYALQRRLAATALPAAPAFLELSAPLGAPHAQCVVELQDAAGGRLRLELQGYDAPALATLGRALWEAQQCSRSPRR